MTRSSYGPVHAAVAWSAATQHEVEQLWDYLVVPDSQGHYDVGIALGSHDLSVADRAAELVGAGVIARLVVSGANSKDTARTLPDGEARHLARRAVELGVDPCSILVEPGATNTAENLTASAALLEASGVSWRSALLITRPYHQRRARATAARCWTGRAVGTAAIQLGLPEYLERIADPRRVVETMVGEVERLVRYVRQGLIVAPPVPGEVVASAASLTRQGFDGRLMARAS